MKRFILLSFVVLFSSGVYANIKRDTVPVIRDSLLEGVGIISNYGNNLDSLLSLWYVQNGIDTSNIVSLLEPDTLEQQTNLPDSVYIQRLAAINSLIDLPYNSIVRNFISVYTERQRDKVEIMLGVADYYLPIFEEVLDYYQLPIELRILPVVESALNPRAVSRAGATGLWQFMYGTGRMYNLTV
ncbi:MAG TPA: transglycosylase SLT domain-containing protein, partial [Tenuifilaceae bacterium]|nr:transglycosylase SLT domain-containing protein [Tenuifilaceae bacterium]